jgi:hypothetical protein
MNDLAEVRRFWPNAGRRYLLGDCYIARPVEHFMLGAVRSNDGSWSVTRYYNGLIRPRHFDGPTIAAAMAAAGFAKRPKGGHAKRRAMLALSARLHPMLPGKTRIPLVYRQRPRKGVRLGKGCRARAAKGGRG